MVQVSAHYPPNFVSGGTIVPQRIARGLLDRGHDVFVYAGYLDAGRRPLSGWTETDSHGVSVRWVVTTPWTGWSDPRNSVNPEVTADFATWLADVQPDVVHLHSLQTLGGGLVRAAKQQGAAVVVTMHDFWWTCARQFLVAPDMRPCSIVVDCGTCRCAGGHAWLERRNRTLHELLGDADLILAPSASAARVLVANGIDERRVRIDENGLPTSELPEGVAEHPAARTEPDAGGHPVRFMFAGGADPMKGLPVLLEAVRGLPDDGSWSLDLYGAAELEAGTPAAVRSLPAYTRADLDAVLAGHDVLVLPSVMRESHSIVTREALAAGLAVICTDTLGPEEAVEHGVNGLVVPAGDAVSLRDALARLAAEPSVVERFRAAGLIRPIRLFGDQLDGLEGIYHELTEREAGGIGSTLGQTAELTAAEQSLVRRVLIVAGIRGAALRYRAHLPAEALRMHGLDVEVRHYRHPSVVELAATADAVVMYRVPATTQIIELIARVRRRERPIPVLFDIDDLIFDPGMRGHVPGLGVLADDEEELWWRGVARYRTTMELCDAYIGSTEALCEHATQTSGLESLRFANGVGRTLARLSERELGRRRRPGPLRIGYFSGTNTHDADWASVEPAVIEVLRRHPDVELWLGGLLTTGAALAPYAKRVLRLPMLPWTELPARLRQVDVNLAPLILDNRFNEAKSAIKWLEAALVDTPTVASPTQPFREAVDDGRTGILASTHEEWVEGISRLLDDALLRRRIGALARREALLRWGPHTQGARYAELLRAAVEIRRKRGVPAASDWVPVADDEPFDAMEGWLDAYPTFPREHRWAIADRVGASRVGQLAAGVSRAFRAGGLPAVVRRTVALLRRVMAKG